MRFIGAVAPQVNIIKTAAICFTNFYANCKLLIIQPMVENADVNQSWGHVTEAGMSQVPAFLMCQSLLVFFAAFTITFGFDWLKYTPQLLFVSSFSTFLLLCPPTKAMLRRRKGWQCSSPQQREERRQAVIDGCLQLQ